MPDHHVVVVLWASERAAVRRPVPARRRDAEPVVTVAGLVYCQYAGSLVYEGGRCSTIYPVSANRFLVKTGPFRVIATSQGNLTLLSDLALDLPKVVNPDGKILCYPHFAACYLMTSMRPASPNSWVGGAYDRHARWYAERANPEDVIVRLKVVDRSSGRSTRWRSGTVGWRSTGPLTRSTRAPPERPGRRLSYTDLCFRARPRAGCAEPARRASRESASGPSPSARAAPRRPRPSRAGTPSARASRPRRRSSPR